MNNGGKAYFINHPQIEALAISLFNEHGEYGCSWQQLSETTRNEYRAQAAGQKPFTVGVSRKKTTED